MKKSYMFLCVSLMASYFSFSQGIGIGTATPDASAVLDITATNKGLLIPRMNTASILAIPSPARGLMVYDSTTNQLKTNIGTPAAPNFQPVASGVGGNFWNLAGNSGTNPANQFIGTTDNQPLRFRINNIQAGELHPVTGNIFWGLRSGQANMTGFSKIAIGTDALKFDADGSNLVAIGDSALFNNGRNNPVPGALAIANTAIGSKSLFANTIGSGNTATGTNSLFSNLDGSDNTAFGVASLFSNTSGGLNTAIGVGALSSNTTGNINTATGWRSLRFNSTGVFNAAFGGNALENNTTGDANTAIGFAALNFNTTGDSNTAVGQRALIFNTTGRLNTGIGSGALFSNTSGQVNTAIGNQSLLSNTIGSANTATGHQALFSNTTGSNNAATGLQSLFSNTTGVFNTANGSKALQNNTIGGGNTATGFESLFTNVEGSGNTATGFTALRESTGNNNTAIGHASLRQNFTGFNNTATGFQSLFANTSGINNTAAGTSSLSSNTIGFQNTALGTFSLLTNNTGSSNTAIGFGADVSVGNLTNATAIGEGAIVNASNKIRLGNGAVTVIEGQVPFTTPSDGRFKFQVKENVKGLDFIMQLRPVTYQFDVKRFDDQQTNKGDDQLIFTSSNSRQVSYAEATAIRRTGFIAQEVEEAANSTGYDFSGIIKPKTEKEHYSLSYESFVVPLVKAMQEQQQMIEELKIQIADLQKEILIWKKNNTTK